MLRNVACPEIIFPISPGNGALGAFFVTFLYKIRDKIFRAVGKFNSHKGTGESDLLPFSCGKAWVNCGKSRNPLWKHWGMAGGNSPQKIRIAN